MKTRVSTEKSSYYVVNVRVDAINYQTATDAVLEWARRGESRYVCAANVHVTMEAYDVPEFRRIVNSADLVTPDGMPLVWMLRLLGERGQERVTGPELTLRVCAAAAQQGIPVGFLGGTEETLRRLINNIRTLFPSIRVVYSYSPPFRPLTPQEDLQLVSAIHDSGARILFVGLGCPKQERWMAAHKGRLNVVMLGVGAAFDFHAGTLPQAPAWMQRSGLEWLFRLVIEPRRLWRRYAKHNPRFLVLALLQLCRLRHFGE